MHAVLSEPTGTRGKKGGRMRRGDNRKVLKEVNVRVRVYQKKPFSGMGSNVSGVERKQKGKGNRRKKEHKR